MPATITSPAVKFNFHGTATPEYLHANHINFFYYKGGDHAVLVQLDPAQQLRVYVQLISDGMYLLTPTQLSKLLKGKDLTLAILEKVPWGRLQYDNLTSLAEEAERVFINYAEPEQEAKGIIGLRDGAHKVAMEHGTTNTTARYFSDFAESVFHGFSFRTFDYHMEYTANGVRLASSSDSSSPDMTTQKRQLKKLATAGLLTVETIRGEGTVLIRFKKEALAGIDFSKSPAFFRTLVY